MLGGSNFTGCSNAKLNELSDGMLREALAIADMPYLPLHHQLVIWSMSDKVIMPIFADSPNIKYARTK